MDNPDDKRSKIYRIKEGFFDLWLSMDQSRKQRQRLPALSQFFEAWYERQEREQKRREMVDQLLARAAAAAEADRLAATLDHLSDAGAADERISAKTRLAAVRRRNGPSPRGGRLHRRGQGLKAGRGHAVGHRSPRPVGRGYSRSSTRSNRSKR